MSDLEFFRALYAGASGHVIISAKAGDSWRNIVRAVDLDGDLSDLLCPGATDHFFTVQPVRSPSSRSSENAASVVALVADFDFRDSSPKHTETGFKDYNDVRSFREAFIPLEPSAYVASGHGVHAYWFLKEPLDPESGLELMRAFGTHLRRQARAYDRGIDASHDLCKALRVPGTTNGKDTAAPKPVSVLELDPRLRYDIDDFDYLEIPGPEVLAPEAGAVESGVRSRRWPSVVANEIERWLERGVRVDGPSDRSAEFARFVGICVGAGLTDEQVWDAVQEHRPSMAKYGDRGEDAFRTIVRRSIDRHRSASDEEAPRLLEVVDLRTLSVKRSEERWLLEPLIPAGRRVSIQGKAGAGKSLLGLHFASALAAGRPVLGCDIDRSVRVLYIDAEMTRADLDERLRTFGFDTDTDSELNENLVYVQDLGITPFDTEVGAKSLLATVDEYLPDLVVFDTVTSLTEGQENSADTYRSFSRLALSPVVGTGAAVLVLDHLGKDRSVGARGSSSKIDAQDVVWQLSTAGDEFRLVRTKSRLPWIPSKVILGRQGGPPLSFSLKSRTDPGDEVFTDDAIDLAAKLDDLGADPSMVRSKARDLLKKNGVEASTGVLASAVRYRKQGTGGQT